MFNLLGWFFLQMFFFLKFLYSEKATKFCEISTVDLSYVVLVKSTVEISQNFVAFSDYMNFTNKSNQLKKVKNWNSFFVKTYGDQRIFFYK